MSKKKNILIVITNMAFAIRQLRWANEIEQCTDWKPVVFCFCSISTIKEIIAIKNLATPNFLFEANVIVTRSVKLLDGFINKSRRLPFSGIFIFILQTIKEVIDTKNKIRDIRILIKDHDISVLFMPESSPAYYSPLLASAAKKENIITITNPLDRDSPESYAMIYKTDSTLSTTGLISKAIAKRFPKWMIEYDGKFILRIAPHQILAQEYLGISSPRPWNTIGFLEDFTITNNKVQTDFILKTGVDPEKIRVVGSSEHDYIFSILKKVGEGKQLILKDLHLPLDKPVILCAMPQTHWIAGRPEAEFQSHKEMLDVWLECLTGQSKYSVILSLHPSMPYEEFLYLEKDNVRIGRSDFVDLIPICSFFVACLSSVMQYAICLGKPVINYDVYRYSEELPHFSFSEAAGAVTVINQFDFNKVFNRMVNDEIYFEEMKKKQESTAKNWGVIDGFAINRLVGFLETEASIN